MYGMPDPTKWHTFFEDFDGLITGTTVAQWTVTGGGTAVVTAADGGALLITTANTDEALQQIQRTSATFLPVAGKKLFFKSKLSLLTTASTDLFIGLSEVDTTLIAASAIGTTECMGFFKAAASSTLTFHNRLDGTTGATSVTVPGTLVDATAFTVGFYFDGINEIQVMFNDKIVARASGASTYLPNSVLSPSIGLAQEGTPGAQTATVDYIFVAQER
jgi:hypothetical protein